MVNQYKYSQPFDRVLSFDEVAYIFGKSKKSIWRWHSKDKTFPSPITLNGRCIGWRESTINKFLETGEVA
ncbi:MAG: helix-turn-helix transcriptional regulator [Vibrio sp.]